MPQVLPQVSQIAPAASDTRPVTQRKGGGFADLLDTMDAGPQDKPRDVEQPAARSRDGDAGDVEPVKMRRRADHAGRRHETRNGVRGEQQDAKTGTDKTEKTNSDQTDVSAADKPKEAEDKDTQDSADAAVDPQAVESVQTPDVQTGMIEAAVAPAPAESADTPAMPADVSAEIEAPQKAAPQMPVQAAAPQAPEADAAPEEKQTADAAQPAKKNEAALPQTKDAAQAADTKSAPQVAKDVAALNPQADDAAKAAQPAPKPERPVMPDASAMRADSDSKSLDGNGDTGPANQTRAAKQPETLENALAKQFGVETKSADNAPVTLPDTARAAQNNFTTASVTVQTSASAATNQPVPLQAAALAIEIASRAKDGMREFQIRLDPPELGRVDVKLNVDKHGQVNTHLTVDRPETLDLLRRDAQSLERALQQSGLKTSDGNLEFSLRQQTPDGFNQRQAQSQGGETNGVLAADDTASSVHAEYQWAARLRGGVDIRV